MQEIAFRFMVQNKGCTDGVCGGFSPVVSATGSLELVIDPIDMSGTIFGAGVPLSWMVKTAAQAHTVSEAVNEITFRLQTNARLYPGTKISIRGLEGSQTQSCLRCTQRGSVIPGLGCSSMCDDCLIKEVPDPENPKLTIQVRQCLPVFNSTGGNHHALLPTPPSSWIKNNLVMTLGSVISEEQPETFVVIVRIAKALVDGCECTPNRPYDEEFKLGAHDNVYVSCRECNI